MTTANIVVKKTRISGHKPCVDVIIPFYEQYQSVIHLVHSLIYTTFSHPFRICLVDDCSPNKEFKVIFKEVQNLKYVRNEEQKGFGASLKVGMENTEFPYVVFMHSDCLIEDMHWLDRLMESLMNLKPYVRMVSARTNNPMCEDTRLIGRLGEMREDVILEAGDYLPLYCTLCHRGLFDRIGGFIKPYPYGGYEDEELAYRMNRFGYKQAICGKSWIKHTGGATLSALYKQNPEIIPVIENNRNLCLADMRKTQQ